MRGMAKVHKRCTEVRVGFCSIMQLLRVAPSQESTARQERADSSSMLHEFDQLPCSLASRRQVLSL